MALSSSGRYGNLPLIWDFLLGANQHMEVRCLNRYSLKNSQSSSFHTYSSPSCVRRASKCQVTTWNESGTPLQLANRNPSN